MNTGPVRVKAAPPTTSAVPRRAAFDDLRVGQWVAWTDGDEALSGTVTSVPDPLMPSRAVALNETNQENNGGKWYINQHECERGEVTILRDAPAAPVTVRREDYDALVAQWESEPTLQRGWITGRIREAVRALIDNADTGDTP